MFKLEKEEFLKFVNSERLLVFANEIEYEIEPELKYIINFDDIPPKAQTVILGYKIKTRKKEENNVFIYDKELNLKTIDEVIDLLNVADYVNVIKINEFDSLDAYFENIEFDNASMEYILNKYNDCNKMSLVTLFDDNYSLTEEEASLAINELKENNLNHIKELYVKNEISEDFDVIINNIKNECLFFKSKHYRKYKKDFENSFICDHVGIDTMYNEPRSFFWHAYHTFGNELDSIELVNKYLKNKKNNKILKFLDEYPKLKNNFISYEITFNTYVTGGPLQIIFYFNLNDETKSYLLHYKDDYSLEYNLADLALYKNDEIQYTSCTHERFRYDNSKK